MVLEKNEKKEIKAFTFCGSGNSYQVDNRRKLELSYFGAPAQRQFTNTKQISEKDKEKISKQERVAPIMEIPSRVT